MVSSSPRAALAVVGVFGISRAIFYLAGVRFDTTPLGCFVQLLDPVLLREDLLRSLFFLNSQPPAFNAYLGLVLKAFPGFESTAFHVLSMAMGLVAAVALTRLMQRLGVRDWLAASLTILFVISPSFILYENLLFYDFPLMALAPISALFLHRFLSTGRAYDGVAFFSMLALTALMRSLYHPVFLVFVAAVVMRFAGGLRARVAWTAAIPIGLVVLVYLKNLIVFGAFTGSTWLGSTIFTSTTDRIPAEERTQLHLSGVLSPAATADNPFEPPDSFLVRGYTRQPARGVPALDQLLKSTGFPNYNNLLYARVSEDCARDARYVISNRPEIYIDAVARGAVLFFGTTRSIWLLDRNRLVIARYERAYNLAVHGQILTPLPRRPDGSAIRPDAVHGFLSMGVLMIVALPALWLWGAVRLWKDLAAGATGGADSAVTAFMLLSILFVFVVSSLLSSAENSRYRLPVDPFFITLAGVAAEQFLARRRERLGITTAQPGRTMLPHAPAHRTGRTCAEQGDRHQGRADTPHFASFGHVLLSSSR